MNPSVTDWIQACAAIATVVGVFVVLFQLRQGSTALRVAYQAFQNASDLQLIQWLEGGRDERKALVAELISAKSTNANYVLSPEQEKRADLVIRKFDMVGYLHRENHIDKAIVERMYAGPIVEVSELCATYLAALSTTRGEKHFWEFRRLVDRMKNVKHPVETSEAWKS